MTIQHQYFCSKCYTSALAASPLHGSAAGGLKSMTHPIVFFLFFCGEFIFVLRGRIFLYLSICQMVF